MSDRGAPHPHTEQDQTSSGGNRPKNTLNLNTDNIREPSKLEIQQLIHLVGQIVERHRQESA